MKKLTAFLASVILLCGCSTTQERFYSNPTAAGQAGLCRALTETQDQQFAQDIAAELARRGVTADDCQRSITSQNVAVAGFAILAGAMIGVAAARAGGGGGTGGYYAPAAAGYAWDNIPNQYGQRVWACRSRATGEFADTWRCPLVRMDAWPYN